MLGTEYNLELTPGQAACNRVCIIPGLFLWWLYMCSLSMCGNEQMWSIRYGNDDSAQERRMILRSKIRIV